MYTQTHPMRIYSAADKHHQENPDPEMDFILYFILAHVSQNVIGLSFDKWTEVSPNFIKIPWQQFTVLFILQVTHIVILFFYSNSFFFHLFLLVGG